MLANRQILTTQISKNILKMLSKKLKLSESTKRLQNADENDDMTSKYFDKPFWKQFYDIECQLNDELRDIKFSSKITHIYNPIEYTKDLHCAYLEKFLAGPKQLVFIGMNPGPNGMIQTGVPFGNITTVRDWMNLSGNVGKPPKEHPRRPVKGLSCTIEEPSGTRLWGLLNEISTDLEIFSRQCYVHNFCPLAFFDKSGQNLTPSELKGDDKKIIRDTCLKYLEKKLDLLCPKIVVAIGSYVGECLRILQKKDSFKNSDIKYLQLAHPSPRSLNNTNWPEKAKKFFEENDLYKYLKDQMENYMKEALTEARIAHKMGEVPVGCVFINENQIIARGGNLVNATKNATRHAEFICIDQVIEYCEKNNLDYKKVFPQISVVVTVEPCIMCATALHNLNVKEIIYGCINDRFGGSTVLNVAEVLQHKIPIKGGIEAEEAMNLLKEFYKGENPSAPVPKKKM